MRDGVHLITYADRLGGGGLDTIGELLTGQLDGAFTGVHLLPFFTPFDGADAGFDPTDHLTVDPRLGDWGSVARIARTHDVTADLIVNHVSDESPQFTDFRRHGDQSEYAGMFLEFDSVFPEGATADELSAIYRPRPGLPFTPVTLDDGSQRRMWTTFTPHQIDLNVTHPQGRSYLTGVLDRFSSAGVAQVRLDAIGYAMKAPGTSCFMTDDTYRFIDGIGAEVSSRRMSSLLEVHSHYSHQQAAAAVTDRVYDFALPPLVLHALYTGSADALRAWLTISPRNAVTVLDTHDGIGVIDVGQAEDMAGLLTAGQIDELVEGIHRASDGESRLATGEAASNLDLYQVNCSYYSALGGDDDRYLLARLIQLLSPGIPQIYYAGLLAARNDMELLGDTGTGRDINRPYFQRSEIDDELQRPVVQRLLGLARFRNRHPAFGGKFTVAGDESTLRLSWDNERATIDARVDLAEGTFTLRHSDQGLQGTIDNWDGFIT